MGVAGTVVFSFTDEWYTGGCDIANWAFGLVDRERRRKPAFQAVQRWYGAPGLPALAEYPKVSVVICAYNAEPTMQACLASLQNLKYPAFEVIVVDDGSTDRTGKIADGFEGIHVIHQENKGLSAARNVGIAASLGEIVAFTDSDCVVDPDWLHYLVATFLQTGLPAVGGPNLPPPEDSVVAACVAASPGGPLHVLLDDVEAEHIPGCNMAFRREVLEEIGGFDPIYRSAGDDVDVCWRLQDRGYRIGFSPAAMVWHFRRNTMKAYIGQQKGYGKAEALLYFRHPQRFNALGYSRWRGRIYGGISALFSLRRPVIYGGVFGRGLFQTLYQPPSTVLSYLPFTLEWNLVGALLLAYGAMKGGWYWLGRGAGRALVGLLRLGRDARAGGHPRGRHPGATAHLGPDLLRPAPALARALQVVGPRAHRGGALAVRSPGAGPALVVAGARLLGRVLDRERAREGDHPPRHDGGARGPQVLRAGGPGLERVGSRRARRRLVARPDQGVHREPRRRAARPPREVRAPDLAARPRGAGRRGGGGGARPAARAARPGGGRRGHRAWWPGAALLRDSVGLGRMLYDALQGVARRARLHYAPPLDASAAEVK